MYDIECSGTLSTEGQLQKKVHISYVFLKSTVLP